jgi:pimeloyl-ACP methyl ester carboxylesterase
VKQIRQGRVDKNMSFDNFIEDAIAVIDFFKKDQKFDRIFIIGHGQGSLIGIIASKDSVDGFISLAGSGKPIDEVILDQIALTAPIFTEDAKSAFAKLKEGKTTDDYPKALVSIFSKDLQPFMSSWMRYHPQEEIAKLDIPVLIISGTKDLQVTVEEAKLLSDAGLNTDLKIIDKMNHILVPIEGDDLENSKSYNESYRKISPEVISFITTFIK